MAKKKEESKELVDTSAIPGMDLLLADDPRGEEDGFGSVIFINFSGKSGQYSVGRDREDMDPDMAFVPDPASFHKGWAFWQARKVIKRYRELWAHADKLPSYEELEGLEEKTNQDGWSEERGFKLGSPEMPGAVFHFTSTSVSGNNSIKDLRDRMRDRGRANVAAFPVFTFEREEFEAQGQTNWKPVFNIKGWLTYPNMCAVAEGKAELDDVLEEDTGRVLRVA